MFFVPTDEFAVYRAALKDVVRRGSSDESYLAAEEELKRGLKDRPGMTTSQICLNNVRLRTAKRSASFPPWIFLCGTRHG